MSKNSEGEEGGRMLKCPEKIITFASFYYCKRHETKSFVVIITIWYDLHIKHN